MKWHTFTLAPCMRISSFGIGITAGVNDDARILL
jgi:hypothetical protein